MGEDELIQETQSNELPPLQEGTEVDRLLSGRVKIQNELDAKIQQLQNLMKSRQNAPLPSESLPFNPALMKMAAGFLAPTKTGSFGESLGMAAQGYSEGANELAKERQAKEARDMQDLETSFKLTQMQGDINKQNLINELASKAITPVTDKQGNVTYRYDQDAASQLAKLTGDTKYIEKIIEQQKSDKKKQAQQSMFVRQVIPGDEKNPTRVGYIPNPDAIGNILQNSENATEDLKAFSESVKELRKTGQLLGVTPASSPFDAIALLTDNPAFKAQAKHLAEQYNAGLIDEDRANALSQQMTSMITSHMDREQSMKFSQNMQNLMLGLRQENLEWQRQKAAQEQSMKLTDQQKIDYNKVIVPTINEGSKATGALMVVEGLKNSIENAPDGAVSGYYNKIIGKWLATDKNEALREIEMKSKQLMTAIPRLPGAQSNFDAQNLEKSLGQLADPTLTNENRKKILAEVEKGFQDLQDRAYEAQVYWESNRKISPTLLGKKTEGQADKASIESMAKSSFGSYEPEKYNYRVVDGKVQRKKK